MLHLADNWMANNWIKIPHMMAETGIPSRKVSIRTQYQHFWGFWFFTLTEVKSSQKKIKLKHLLPHQEMIGAVFSSSHFIDCIGACVSKVLKAIATGND